MEQAFVKKGKTHGGLSRWCVLAFIVAALAPGRLQADTKVQPRHRAHKAPGRLAVAPSRPNWVSLGRYVALAPGCKLRDTLWAERLDMALSNAIAEAGADPTLDQQGLTEAERQAADEVAANGTTICRTLSDPSASSELRRADALVK